MTIDEAIIHAEEVAEEQDENALCAYAKAEDGTNELYRNEGDRCTECADEHRQLAEWLYQLKQIQDIVQEYHDNYIEWGTGQSSVAFHKIVKIIEGGEE